MSETTDQTLSRLLKFTNIMTMGLPGNKTDWQVVIEFNEGISALELSNFLSKFARRGESN